jgi:uncharacterized damage-inducible protein DinB
MSELVELSDKLKVEGEKLIAIFEGFTEEQWAASVYTDGELWTLRNVLSHLVTSERGLLKLFERIRTTGEGASEDFSIDRFNAAQQYKTKELTALELLEQYKTVRAESVAWVSALQDTELEITGRHPFLGMTTIREMIKMLYLHNQMHYRDVKRALKSPTG